MKTSIQLSLDGIADATGAENSDDLPSGMADLSGKELAFVGALVRGKNQTEAAVEAGYLGSPETLHSTASKLLRRPAVRRFYARCVARIAASSDLIAARLCERSLALHQITMDQRERFETAQERVRILIERVRDVATAEGPLDSSLTNQLRLEISERDTSWRQFIQAAREATNSDSSLFAMIGKIRPANQGESTFIAVSSQALALLSSARQEAHREAG